MQLARKLSGDFTNRTRQLGQDYYWQSCVTIEYGSADLVEARVQGTRAYNVRLAWEDGLLDASCDCAYFDSDGACKHVWATILAADSRRYLSAVSARYPILRAVDTAGEFSLPPYARAAIPKAAPKLLPPAWKTQIEGISGGQEVRPADAWPAKRQILYVVDIPGSNSESGLVLSLGSRDAKANGDYTRAKSLTLKRSQIPQLPFPLDREIAAALAGGTQYYAYGYGWGGAGMQLPGSFSLMHPLAGKVLELAAATGRCLLRTTTGDWDRLTPLVWDQGGAWQLGLEMCAAARARWAVAGVLRRGEERMDLAAPVLVTVGGLVITGDRVAPLAEETPFEWMLHLRKTGAIEAPREAQDDLLAALLSAPKLPPLEVPEELRYEEVTLAPRPGLRIKGAETHARSLGKLRAELSFDYEGRLVPALDLTRGIFDAATRRFFLRDAAAEKAASELLAGLGVKFHKGDYWNPIPVWELSPARLPRTVRALVEAGWQIEADGKVFRRPGEFRMQVSSGVDWFELHGEVDYGETSAKLPELLEALRKGDSMVRLGDGTYGVLPEEWLRRIGLLAGAGAPKNGHLRFRRNQAGLLDALLATQPEASCDETFARMRQELRRFHGVEAAPQPAGFEGQLREYQREGLGWMEFLRRFSFGGCLADDMGVGKTAQVLALLETRRELRAARENVAPSLVVVPKSLIFNWKQEAERFTPRLRVLDHTGLDRSTEEFAAYDVILTTYGTLRRDAILLKDVAFDYVVLDEAQAVKNAATESAKAVRLLQGDHRLALSGTPVENHLGELWSLFEFLNPGMLGASGAFKLTNGAARNPDEDTRRLLAHALRPFLLRRTKEQVARELPSKTEQTIYCEMEPPQRKLYNELRQHYRDALLARIETEGMAKSKIQVLEALLRLRQASCHPGLLDPKRSGEASAKLDVLLYRLREVMEEGHKALVFSQFTSLLAIVRQRLDGEGVAYQYLDGRTRDRQAPVERFQNDPDCKLFLVSLKAGGLGLNLTAAEYVFLLDPWWNPAVEAQAVDRAHRIGQTRQVFAYRLIARDTVEEKVLELQKSKRDLAAALISADNSVIRNLRREDLELLLS